LGSGRAKEEKLKAEVERLSREHYAAFIRGVQQYQQSPFKRNISAPPVIWREGTTRVLDFGGKGRAVLVIPSLINRYHVLDIEGDKSFLRNMRARGFRPLLVDWGEPGKAESAFSFDDYTRRLQKALELAHRENGGRVPVIGYCMGGLFAAALAALEPKKISRLVFLATPWDFHSGEDKARFRDITAQLLASLEKWNELPVDVMQAFFIMIAPFAVLDKFIRFAKLPPKSAAAKSFVLLEDWVNDGVPLPKNLAHECLVQWYAENLPARGTWKVSGKIVKPAQCRIPSLHVIPSRDRIVPPQSAEALAKSMPKAKMLKPAFGHVSMMAHADAAKTLWPQIFDWLASPRADH
jgi:polyhydroxyalkanoate synthase